MDAERAERDAGEFIELTMLVQNDGQGDCHPPDAGRAERGAGARPKRRALRGRNRLFSAFPPSLSKRRKPESRAFRRRPGTAAISDRFRGTGPIERFDHACTELVKVRS